MRARDVMTADVISVSPETSIRELIGLLLGHRISGVPVLDAGGRLVGIVSEGDLILREKLQLPRTETAHLFQQLFEDHAKLAREYRKAYGLTVGDVMTREVISVLPGTPVAEIARLMTERGIKRVPVLDGERMVGIVTRHDVLKAVYGRLDEAERRGADERLTDDEIRQRLLEALRGEPWVEVSHLRIQAQDGIVTLRGLAENDQEREAIELAARRTPGVREVRNELKVSPGIALG